MSIKFRDLRVTINVQAPNVAKEVEKKQPKKEIDNSLPSLLSVLSNVALVDKFCNQKEAAKGLYPKTDAPDGVYIVTADDYCIEPEFWGIHKDLECNVVGCAIIEGNKRVLIAPDEPEDDLEYASEYDEIPGLKTLDRDNAKEDWGGSNNTSMLLSHAKSEAAMYCKKYGILNRAAGTWHLPALAEMIFAQKYIDRVNACFTLSGKTPIKFTDWYWSSTQYSSTYAWLLYWSDGYVSTSTKDTTYRVRAFAAL
jgi:hypothetical protein